MIRTCSSIVMVLVVLLVSSGVASAVSDLVTPMILVQFSHGYYYCTVNNTGTRPITVRIRIFNGSGEVQADRAPETLNGGQGTFTSAIPNGQFEYCRITTSNRTFTRGSLLILDGGFNTLQIIEAR